MSENSTWWTLLFNVDDDADLDSIGCELIERGAFGTELIGNDEIRCYFQGNESELENLKNNISDLPLKIKSSELLPSENWVQKCEDVWQQLDIDRISIIPVMSLEKGESLPPATAQKIYIIPGCGFGTGHHATTNQATAILQSEILKNEKITKVLDVGTGSGLLAIVANRIFNVPVDAFDNDSDAVNNARDNIILNGVQDNINLQVADAMSWNKGVYDLVIANLYAELLEKLHDTLYNSTKIWLLISGFRSPDLPELSKFNNPLWERVDVRTQDNWSAMLLRKN